MANPTRTLTAGKIYGHNTNMRRGLHHTPAATHFVVRSCDEVNEPEQILIRDCLNGRKVQALIDFLNSKGVHGGCSLASLLEKLPGQAFMLSGDGAEMVCIFTGVCWFAGTMADIAEARAKLFLGIFGK